MDEPEKESQHAKLCCANDVPLFFLDNKKSLYIKEFLFFLDAIY